jgi:hypothetical protein
MIQAQGHSGLGCTNFTTPKDIDFIEIELKLNASLNSICCLASYFQTGGKYEQDNARRQPLTLDTGQPFIISSCEQGDRATTSRGETFR